ncbi:hypothetical protein XELAEV_18047913mg [Xenopus laevis]|nr:hypothetical protein XELAEV_18047913mg [Xenopus laevis]
MNAVGYAILFPGLIIALSILGILTSMFIMSVNFQSWIKGQNLNPTDLLNVALAFCNMVFSVSNYAFITCIFFITCWVFEYQVYVENYCFAYSLFCNSWLSSCLCFFYFVKVNNFKPGYLAWLKLRINTLVPRLILGTQVFSVLNSLLYLLGFSDENVENSAVPLVTNQTAIITDYRTCIYFYIFLLFINCCIPFLIILVTTSLNISSLYNHICRMQKNLGEFGGPSMKIHQRTVLTMTLLLIFYMLFYAVVLGYSFFLNTELFIWVYYTALSFFPPLQSIILIMGNSRLKQTCVNILNSCRKMFSERENAPTICT